MYGFGLLLCRLRNVFQWIFDNSERPWMGSSQKKHLKKATGIWLIYRLPCQMQNLWNAIYLSTIIIMRSHWQNQSINSIGNIESWAECRWSTVSRIYNLKFHFVRPRDLKKWKIHRRHRSFGTVTMPTPHMLFQSHVSRPTHEIGNVSNVQETKENTHTTHTALTILPHSAKKQQQMCMEWVFQKKKKRTENTNKRRRVWMGYIQRQK